jgi:uncharacterized membrane protein
MRTLLRFSTLLVFLSLCQADWTKPAAVEAQTVRAVLFYAPGCPHCRHVISQDLPVFFEIYGGPPRVWVNESAAEEDRVLSLASNGELEILLVDASLPVGAELYQASMLSHPVTPERDGVPRLVIGDTVLVGAVEIPARFHGLIGQALATGGAAWPAITGLEEIIAAFPGASIAAATEGKPVSPPVITDEGESAAADTVQTSGESPEVAHVAPAAQADAGPVGEAKTAPGVVAGAGPEVLSEVEAGRRDEVQLDSSASVLPSADRSTLEERADSTKAMQPTLESIAERRPSMLENLRRDPVGNGIAVVVLIGMLISVAGVSTISRFRTLSPKVGFAVPLVSLLGIVVAGYLTYVEASGATAVCGPVGDCNAVQQSKYAILFGVLPVGALGLAGFTAIIVAWIVSRTASDPVSDWAKLSLLAMTVLGTLLSIYLTFLEPFVIGATCSWCLTSAVAITVLMWLSAGSGTEAWSRLGHGRVSSAT